MPELSADPWSWCALQTMQKNDKMLVAMAAVFLASKSENHPRSLDDVLHASFKEQYGKDKEQAVKMASMMKDRQQHDWLRDSVLKVTAIRGDKLQIRVFPVRVALKLRSSAGSGRPDWPQPGTFRASNRLRTASALLTLCT